MIALVKPNIFVFGFPGFLAFAILLEQLREVFQRLLLPTVQLIRMDPAFRGDLGYALIFAEYFQDHLGFLISGEVRFLGIVSPKVHLNYALGLSPEKKQNGPSANINHIQ